MPFTPKDWHDSPTADTPISAVALEDMETRLSAYTDVGDGTLNTRLTSVESTRLLLLAYDPDALLVGAFTRDANGALTSASAVWPDGATGTFTGTPSTVAPGRSTPTRLPTSPERPRPTPSPR